MHIEEVVKQVIASCFVCDISELDLNTHLVKELYADSIDMMDIVFILEDVFNINIDEHEIPKMKTIKGICDIVNQHVVASEK
ncbi:acyl carrier protein [Citrobacter portucalensis]|uniref:acyl carrier protein n=1 Tax=Citrobacter portucalensis TaxID=1639133 RepID=UPI001ECFE6B6|nr:acyl carrier protein [Citrobacter portucalensis]EDS3841739.1 acyl carrier protein [Salmonella enterica]WNI88039.1 acyl carrier protein [Citrobacter portucalensis]